MTRNVSHHGPVTGLTFNVWDEDALDCAVDGPYYTVTVEYPSLRWPLVDNTPTVSTVSNDTTYADEDVRESPSMLFGDVLTAVTTSSDYSVAHIRAALSFLPDHEYHFVMHVMHCYGDEEYGVNPPTEMNDMLEYVHRNSTFDTVRTHAETDQ